MGPYPSYWPHSSVAPLQPKFLSHHHEGDEHGHPTGKSALSTEHPEDTEQENGFEVENNKSLHQKKWYPGNGEIFHPIVQMSHCCEEWKASKVQL